MQVRVDVCIGSECVCVNGWEKEDHFIHCQQVVSKGNLYTVGKLFLRVTINILKDRLKLW